MVNCEVGSTRSNAFIPVYGIIELPCMAATAAYSNFYAAGLLLLHVQYRQP